MPFFLACFRVAVARAVMFYGFKICLDSGNNLFSGLHNFLWEKKEVMGFISDMEEVGFFLVLFEGKKQIGAGRKKICTPLLEKDFIEIKRNIYIF